MSTLVQAVEAEQLKAEIPAFGPGDTVRVHAKVVEGTRERIQVFEGVVIRRRNGGANENFTVRRAAAHGIGVERTFLINSPRIDKIEVVRNGKVRRARLYFLRGRTGRAARIRERRRPAGSTGLHGGRQAELITAPIAEELETTLVEEHDQVEVAEAEEAQVQEATAAAEEVNETEAADAGEAAVAEVEAPAEAAGDPEVAAEDAPADKADES